VLGKLARQHDPNVLVGFDHADDAGVYQLTPDQALVQTVDFFTPIVDDPFTFGQIAATNSLSDIYAMGGRPLTALALVCFPEKADLAILERILAGGLSKMIEANCVVLGGHSIRDEETKFGYSVTGLIHPKKILQNEGAQPGDALIFTKALGTGVISTAIKKGKAEQNWIDAAVASMTTLNKKAADVISTNHVGTAASAVQSSEARQSAASEQKLSSRASRSISDGGSRDLGFRVSAMTDVTGFSLIGHLREILLASYVSAKIFASRIPILPGALECIRAGYIPGGLNNNRNFAECLVEYDDGIPEEIKSLLFDPQTAGGLLICTPDSDALTQALIAVGIRAVQIGEILPESKPRIHVTK
jgi:selenide, water dikinase